MILKISTWDNSYNIEYFVENCCYNFFFRSWFSRSIFVYFWWLFSRNRVYQSSETIQSSSPNELWKFYLYWLKISIIKWNFKNKLLIIFFFIFLHAKYRFSSLTHIYLNIPININQFITGNLSTAKILSINSNKNTKEIKQ